MDRLILGSGTLASRCTITARSIPGAVAGRLVLCLAAMAPAFVLGQGRQESPGRVGARSHPYAITGYWLFGRRSAADWRRVLTRIHRLGADTVVQFGPRLRRTTLAELREQAAFSACRPLIESSAADVATTAPGARLRYVFTLSSRETYGPALLLRPEWDRRLVTDTGVFWRLVIPLPLPADAVPDSAVAEYDLVFIAGQTNDSVSFLFAEAGRLGLSVYVGVPAAPVHPAYAWETWSAARPTFLEFSRRVLSDYARRYAGFAAFSGVYQSVEVPAQKRSLPNVLACYRSHHALVRQLLPGKRILVSPYWDARRGRGTGGDPLSVKAGIKAVAGSDVDIIAPQDGRGTGKVALFWPAEAALPVDPRLRPALDVGAPGDTGESPTNGQAYFANTREFYRQARAAVDELREEGKGVELWANLEAFEPGKGIPCGSFRTTQRTTKERLDRAVMFAGPHPSKLISYMWDSYYVCRAGHPESLGDAIERDWRRPILVDVRRRMRERRNGLLLYGYNLIPGSVEIDTRAGPPIVVPLDERHADTGFGSRNPRYPERLQEAWAPVPVPARAGLLHVRVSGPGGTCHHPFLLAD